MVSDDLCGRGSAWAEEKRPALFPLFPLGRIVAMPAARDALGREKEPTTCFLARHATGEWGELDPADVAENEHSIIHRFRLLSSRPTDTGEKL